jgi:TolB-like protein/DNA-binding SARP family transcriptional activator
MQTELRTLGTIDLRTPDGVAVQSVLVQPKQLGVLVYLTLAVPEGFVRRDTLTALFWPDLDQQHARTVLRKTVFHLRHALGGATVIGRGEEELALAPHAVWCDVLALRELLAAGRPAEALALYRGDLLTGFYLPETPAFEHWLDGERQSVRRLAASAAWRAAEAEEAAGNSAAAIEHGRRAIALAPDDENATRQLLSLLDRAGDSAGAFRLYEEHRHRLEAEFELQPAPETRTLLERIRARTTVMRRPRPTTDAPDADPVPAAALFAEALGPQASAAVTSATVRSAASVPRRRSWQRISQLAIAAVVVIGVAMVVGRWTRLGSPAPLATGTHERTAIAVLPFQNLSAEGPHSYFAGGLHDELLTQLAKVTALKPISRTSVMEYATRTKPLRQIADELDVGTIVEGSVQVVGQRLRVTVQLIDAATDQHLWAEHYTRTLDDAFAVQSEIAQRIVTAVGATLGGTERTALAAAPTASPEAYRLYLQGLEYDSRPGRLRRNRETAQYFYERAVALDSTFALAHAALSQVHGHMSWFRHDPSPERLVHQRVEAEIALQLTPHLPQAHLAMGLVHYNGRQDWQAALNEYHIALEGLPNDARLWEFIGYARRRLGNWDEALAALDKVVALDPRNADALWELGGQTFRFLRRYQEAVDWFSRALTLAPDAAGIDVCHGWTWVAWQGRLDSLGAALDRHPPDADLGAYGSASAWQALKLYWERQPDSLLRLLRGTPQPVLDGMKFYLPTALYAAWAHQLRGDGVAARAAFDSARALIDSVVAVLPDDYRLHAARGLALAGLGRHREAQREARWLQQSKIYREDPYDGPLLAEDRARILVGIGDADAALAEIERLLAGPSELSVHTLRLDPRWDPIREHPQFQALLAKYAEPKPVR